MRVWLKQRRELRKLNHEEVAMLSGISRSYYTHIELGNKTPTVDVAKSIAKVLKFDWTLFFEEQCSYGEQNQTTA